jgi:excisionase family DNA binding protein
MTLSSELTIEDILQDLQIGRATLYRLIETDADFITYKVGGSRRMSRADLERWKDKQKTRERAA